MQFGKRHGHRRLFGVRCASVAVLALQLGCRPTPPGPSIQRRSAATAEQKAQICQQSCQRAQSCAQDRSVSDCQARCERAEASALQQCHWVQECPAYLACHDRALPAAAQGPQVASSCQNLCSQLAQCQGQQQCQSRHFGALAVPSCESDSSDSPADQSCEQRCQSLAQPCQASMNCAELELCLSERPAVAWSSATPARASHQGPTPPPHALDAQGEPQCVALCDRALRCGIQASGATKPQAEQLEKKLPAALLDSRTECLMQCQADHTSERRAEFQRCLELGPCEDFIDCANEL